MKFTLSALLPLAAASLAVAASSDDVSSGAKQIAQQVNHLTEGSVGTQLFDDDGQPMIFTTNEEEDKAASQPSRRRNKKHGKHHKVAAKGNTFKAVTSSLPTGQEKMASNIQVTWYGAHDLLAPSCGDGSWNPNDNSYIGAVGQWPGKPKCGEYVNICNEKGKTKCITVRIVDSCAACRDNHIDLTKGAFSELAGSGGLDEGVVDNLSLYKANTPNPFNTDLFGPFKLKA
ncbi:unnamed protein product [Parajaminaea phylloscopi]